MSVLAPSVINRNL